MRGNPEPNGPMRSGLGHLDEVNRYIVEDHCRNPRNGDPITDPDAEATIDNPFCGDEVSVQLRVEDGRVTELCVIGSGCAITQASSSIMGELVEGKSCSEIVEIAGVFRQMMVQGRVPDGVDEDVLGDAVVLRDVSRFPVRVKCALLAWATLGDAIGSLGS